MKKKTDIRNIRLRRLVYFFEDGSLMPLAQKYGATRQYISLELSKEHFNPSFFEKILGLYPDINEQWIRTGEGCPLKLCEDNSTNLKILERALKIVQEENDRLRKELGFS